MPGPASNPRPPARSYTSARGPPGAPADRRAPVRGLPRGPPRHGERGLRLVHAGGRERDRRPVPGAVRGRRMEGGADPARAERRRAAARRPRDRTARRGRRSARPDDRPHRHRLRAGNGGRTPLPDRGRPCDGPRRLRHEGRPAHRVLRGGGPSGGRVRRVRLHHLHLQPRRGDRLALLPLAHPAGGHGRGRRVRPGGRAGERGHRVGPKGGLGLPDRDPRAGPPTPASSRNGDEARSWRPPTRSSRCTS